MQRPTAFVTVAMAALLLARPGVSTVPDRAVVVIGMVLSDNGDDDGWADSDETVLARPRLWNRSGVELSGVVVRLSTSDPSVACVANEMVSIGDMAVDEMRLAPPFSFIVDAVDRATLEGEFAAWLTVEIDADQFDEPQSTAYVIELDLDASGGGQADVVSEGFEQATLGIFSDAQLDVGLDSLAASDGYRCQYNDPDWPNSTTFGQPQADNCFLGGNADPDPSHWHVLHSTIPGQEDRAFSGSGALHWGVPLCCGLGFTTPVGALEAVVLTNPVNVNHGRVCSAARHTCADETDCPLGESCERVSPELSFKHQISLMDYRTVSNGPTESETIDRAVVQIQLADQDGDPVGVWHTLEPYRNVYDAEPFVAYPECSFDPVDDGNTEDDFFDPDDPDRRLGPSSMCAPKKVFGFLGDTFFPFAPENLGRASDGPGLQAVDGLGNGTWVESRFSLERFRGRRVRVRFLAGSLKVSDLQTYEHLFAHNPHPGDDGWFIDDVTFSDVLTSPALLAVDNTDNSPLRMDQDGDGTVDPCDCAPSSPDDLALQGATIDETVEYVACESIAAGPDLHVVSPGEVTLRSGTVIALWSGFSIGDGARFTASLDPLVCPLCE